MGSQFQVNYVALTWDMACWWTWRKPNLSHSACKHWSPSSGGPPNWVIFPQKNFMTVSTVISWPVFTFSVFKVSKYSYCFPCCYIWIVKQNSLVLFLILDRMAGHSNQSSSSLDQAYDLGILLFKTFSLYWVVWRTWYLVEFQPRIGIFLVCVKSPCLLSCLQAWHPQRKCNPQIV